MTFLLGVMAFYFLLAVIVVSAVWLSIAHKGFDGLEQTNSVLAKLFAPRVTVVPEAISETNSTINVFPQAGVVAPLLATTFLATIMIVSFGDANRPGENARNVAQSPITSSTCAPLMQELDANLY